MYYQNVVDERIFITSFGLDISTITDREHLTASSLDDHWRTTATSQKQH
jgi:hypothetical protein